jgi:hypothetical protein
LYQTIIARESVIGAALQQQLLSKTFAEKFNVMTLTPVDVLKLLRAKLPRLIGLF